eukprot:GAHX01001569.1.p1 GENE.GAHX01001569.1~~GAHX01001569.1.p1  ORF type:complete len:1231 (-),score=359.42 GAHX01001569.1:23-3715(-)
MTTEENSKGDNDKILKIEKIVFKNFKSFAGTVEIQNINGYFNSIVGPNGSGKSNILDGLLFVFGKRTKQIRLNKLSELIFNSTETVGKINSASVTIHFLEYNKDTPEDKVTFTIAREAYFNNISKYFINEKAVKFDDLYTFLLGKNLDIKNNRFIILQGEIDSISMMKPKAIRETEVGLLEYLEDVIGTGQYLVPLNNIEKKLDKINDKKGEKTRRLKLVEKDIKSLEVQKDEAMDLVVLRFRISKIKQNLIDKDNKSLGEEGLGVKEQYVKIQEKAKQSEGVINGLENSIKVSKDNIKTYTESHKTHKKEEDNLNKKLYSLEKRDLAIQEKLKYQKEKYESAVKQIKDVQGDIKEKEEQYQDNNKEFKSISESIGKMTEEVKSIEVKLDKEYELVKTKAEKIQQKLEAKKKEFSPFLSKLKDLEASLVGINKNISLLEENTKHVEQELGSMESKENKLSEQQKSEKGVLKTVGTETKELSILQGEKNAELGTNQTVLKSLYEKRKKLNEEIRIYSAQLNSQKNRSNIENSVIKLARHRKGIFGKLGKLCSIDKKYDVAVSSASGAWGYYLVDTTETAAYCIDYLRKNRIGSATFLALDKQQHFFTRMNKSFDTPADSMRLFDCLHIPDDKYKPAAYFAVKDTLVVDNINTATRLSYDNQRRRRVVTLKGEVVDVSGTITGGGGDKFVKRGFVNIKDGKNQDTYDPNNEVKLAGLKGDCEAVNSKIDNLNADISETQSLLTKVAKKLSENQTLTSKANNSIEEIDRQYNKTISAIKNLKTKYKQMTSDLNEKRKEKEQITQSKSELENKSKKERGELQSLEESLNAAYGKTYCMLKAKFNNESERLNKEQIRINELEGLLSIYPETKTETEKSLKNLIEEKDAIIGRGKEIKKSLSEIESEAINLSEESAKIEKIMAKLNEEIDKHEKEISKLTKEIEKTRQNDKDLYNMIDDTKRKLVDINKNIEANKMEKERLGGILAEISTFVKTYVTEKEASEFIEKDYAEFSNEEDLELLENNLKKHKGSGYEDNIREYYKRKVDVDAKANELKEILVAYEECKTEREALLKKRLTEFMQGFNTIATKTKSIYRILTLGGDAELELVDNLDPFAEGISYSVRPPNKSWKTIQNLSGGEKTLSSLALVFALHHFKPAPLYIMDEIDAALDFKNVSIVANFIKNTSKTAQFIVVSLRNNLFELADRLIGIYKTFNKSKTISIKAPVNKKDNKQMLAK